MVHPIEHLRYVARSGGEGPSAFVPEVADAMMGLRHDPLALVPACRRLLSRHPEMGPLWWLFARMLGSPDPYTEAQRCVAEIEGDRTPFVLAGNMPEEARVVVMGWPELASRGLRRRGDARVLAVDAGREAYGLGDWLRHDEMEVTEVSESGLGAAVAQADLVLLEAWSLGGGEFVASSGSRAGAAVARAAGVKVWLVAGVGRVLPNRLWDAFISNFEAVNLQSWERPDEVVPLDMVDAVVGPAGLSDVPGALRRADCPVVAELLGPFTT